MQTSQCSFCFSQLHVTVSLLSISNQLPGCSHQHSRPTFRESLLSTKRLKALVSAHWVSPYSSSSDFSTSIPSSLSATIFQLAILFFEDFSFLKPDDSSPRSSSSCSRSPTTDSVHVTSRCLVQDHYYWLFAVSLLHVFFSYQRHL